jgi:hypothetical protein
MQQFKQQVPHVASPRIVLKIRMRHTLLTFTMGGIISVGKGIRKEDGHLGAIPTL